MKKISKKIIIIVACVVLAVCIALGTMFLIYRSGDCVLALGQQTSLAGDTVELEVTLDKNKGFFYGCITLEYDANSIEFISYASGEVFDECAINDVGGQVVMLVNQSDLSVSRENGVVAKLKFKVKQNAKDGDYKISFVDETNFCNLDDPEDLIVPELIDGKITVK